MVTSEFIARRDLGEYFPELYGLVSEAVAAYNSYPAAFKKAHSLRSRASLIHDHFVECAAVYAALHEDTFTLVETQRMWVLYFESGYCLRFKKVDDEKMSSGHLTEQFKNFRSQIDVDGIPQSTHLELGYQLSALGQLAHLYLVCPSGIQSNAWDIEITPTEAKSVVVDLFPTPKDDGGSVAGGKVIPKRRDVDESESGNGDSGA